MKQQIARLFKREQKNLTTLMIVEAYHFIKRNNI